MSRPGMPKSQLRPLMPSWAIALLALLLTVAGGGLVCTQYTDSQPDQVAKPSAQVVRKPPAQAVNKQPVQVASPQASGPVASPPPVVHPTPARPPAPKVRGKGTLELRVYPYATVFVGGRELGHTPMKPLQLPAGRHIIKFVHPDRTIEREVDVNAGQDNLLKIDMLKE